MRGKIGEKMREERREYGKAWQGNIRELTERDDIGMKVTRRYTKRGVVKKHLRGLRVSRGFPMIQFQLGCAVGQWLSCWTANREVRGSNTGRAEIWFEISAPPA